LWKYVENKNNTAYKNSDSKTVFIYCPHINQIVLSAQWIVIRNYRLSFNYYPYRDAYIKDIYDKKGKGRYSFRNLVIAGTNLSDYNILMNSYPTNKKILVDRKNNIK